MIDDRIFISVDFLCWYGLVVIFIFHFNDSIFKSNPTLPQICCVIS